MTTGVIEMLKVQLFGHFRIYDETHSVDEENIRSDMVTKLLAYVICHRDKALSVQELINILWEEDASENPGGALKNLMYRCRNILKKEWLDTTFIHSGRGFYKWNEEVAVVTDMDQFEQFYTEALGETDEDKRLELYLKAAGLYKGTFLPKLGGEYWAASLSVYFHSRYLTAVKRAAKLLEKYGRYDELAQLCAAAVIQDNLDDTLYCYFIRALLYQKKYDMAMEQYKNACTQLYENLGISPSEELRSVYGELLKRTHEVEKDIRRVINELGEKDSEGAFLCEYGIFREVYQLERRRSGRTGEPSCLLLISVEPDTQNGRGEIWLKQVSEGMGILENALLRCLRAGDVLAKYSGTQYVVLLPGCGRDTAEGVVKRITDAYVGSHSGAKKTRSRLSLSCSFEEIHFS